MIIKIGERNFEKHRNKLEQGVMIEIMQRAFPDTERILRSKLLPEPKT